MSDLQPGAVLEYRHKSSRGRGNISRSTVTLESRWPHDDGWFLVGGGGLTDEAIGVTWFPVEDKSASR